MQSQETTVALYENAVPAFVEADLERLYESVYSTLAHHTLHGGITEATCTYVAERNGKTNALLLFKREGDKVRVLNEQICIGDEEITRFARHIFTTYASVSVIEFNAIKADLQRMSFPCQHFQCTEDIVLTLPASEETYRASLGKSTRSYINRYMNKLRRECPTFRHEVCDGNAVSEDDLLAILAMNTARMATKNRQSYIDDEETRRILYFARTCGMISIIRIDGRVCAGAINFRIGNHFYLKVIAHDPAYNDYRLGTLCCYLTICECIRRGGVEYHFLWGRYEYKYRLLGVQRNLEHVAIYRSHAHLLRNGGTALRNALKGFSLDARSWLLTKARQDDSVGHTLRRAAQVMQKLRPAKAIASTER